MKKWIGILACAAALATVSCDGGSSIGGLDAETVYVFALSQSAEVPTPKSTTAAGSAEVVIYPDRIEYDVTGSSITGVTMAHIHSGPIGSTGPVVVTMLNQPNSPSGTINGRIVSGVVNSTNLPAGYTLESFKAFLRSGNAYVNVHTSANPNGEIRGQIR